MTFESDSEFQSRVVYWQKLLRLEDWDVFASLVTQNQMFETGTKGGLNAAYSIGQAEIRISRTADMPVGIEHDQEATLVHELLHLHFEKSGPDPEEDPTAYAAWEQGIERTAQALVKLARLAPKQTVVQ